MSQRKIIIHVGAHKTASTYIQEALAINADASAAAGRAYWPRERFRPSLANAVRRSQQLASSRRARWAARIGIDPRDPSTGLRRLVSIDYGITLSEENLLGDPDQCFSGSLYPNAQRNLQVLKSALPERPVEIMIALRSYPAFMSSLFGEALKNGAMVTPQQARAMRPTLSGGWQSVIASIRSIFPEAPITAWKYEDFARLEDGLLCRMSGLEPGQLKKPANGDILPSPSSEAIEGMLDLPADKHWIERVIDMRALRAKYPRTKSSTKFTLWTNEETEQLARQYEQDIEQIKSLSYVDFLS